MAIFQFSFQIAAVEETDVDGAGCIADRDVENGAAAALEADGGASAARDFGENCLDLAGDYFGDGGEAEAVFIAEREIAQQIADGDDAASFESGGALRAYAVEVFDRVGEGDGHRDVCACLAPAVASLLYHRSRVAREGAAFTDTKQRGKNIELTE